MCMMNLDWRSISHMVIYMFQCYSFKLSLPTFSHRAQKSVLYTSVFFDVLHLGLLRGVSSAPGKGLQEGGLAYAKAGSSLRSLPGNS